MLYDYSLSSGREDFYNITPQVREAVTKSGVTDGIAVIYCPHTTAGITINENADPDVVHDMLIGLDKAFPNRAEFQHGEGNSSAHLKASAMLGLSGKDPKDGAEQIEQLFQRLKKEFWSKNSVQALSQILVLGDMREEAVGHVLDLRNVLRNNRIKLDKTYTLPALGVLSLLPVEGNVLAQDILEAQAYLREQKGFGAFSVTSQELLLYATAIIASSYAENMDSISTVSVSTSIASIIIAQQTAIIAAAAASSAAASSSS